MKRLLLRGAQSTGKSQRHLAGQGQGIIEMIFGMIMFVSMISLSCTVCMYLYMQHALVSAAREGARTAAIQEGYATGAAASATAAVTAAVKNFVQQTTGQTLADSNVVVTPPSGATGQRNVRVQVNYTLKNPIPIAGFMSGLGATGTSSYDNISMAASSTMRYEE
jgi:hypothetical protein